MKDWKIGLKMSLGSGLILTLIVLNGALSVTTLKTIGKDVTGLTSATVPLTSSAVAARGHLRDAPGYMNIYLLTGSQDAWKQVEQSLDLSASELARTRLLAEAASHESKTLVEQAKHKTQAMLVAAGELEEVVNIVSSASTELSAQIDQSKSGARYQSEMVTETATAMEEMNSTVMEVARNAGDAAVIPARTRERADSGAEVVTKAVGSIRQVQQEAVSELCAR